MRTSYSLLSPFPAAVIESWMDVIMICCQSPEARSDGGRCVHAKPAAVAHEWVLAVTGVASLSHTPYLPWVMAAGSPLDLSAGSQHQLPPVHMYHSDIWTAGIDGEKKALERKGKTVQVLSSVRVNICVLVLQAPTFTVYIILLKSQCKLDHNVDWAEAHVTFWTRPICHL